MNETTTFNRQKCDWFAPDDIDSFVRQFNGKKRSVLFIIHGEKEYLKLTFKGFLFDSNTDWVLPWWNHVDRAGQHRPTSGRVGGQLVVRRIDNGSGRRRGFHPSQVQTSIGRRFKRAFISQRGSSRMVFSAVFSVKLDQMSLAGRLGRPLGCHSSAGKHGSPESYLMSSWLLLSVDICWVLMEIKFVDFGYNLRKFVNQSLKVVRGIN